MQKLFGTVVPIITPLTEDDKIDVQSLKNLVDHCINNGLQCLYPCGTTGEMYLMSAEQRELVAETVVKTAAGRICPSSSTSSPGAALRAAACTSPSWI